MTEKEILSLWPEIKGKLVYILYGTKGQTAKTEQVRFINLTEVKVRDRYLETAAGGQYRVRSILAIKPRGMTFAAWLEEVVEPLKKITVPKNHKTDGLINLITREKLHFTAEPIPSPPDPPKFTPPAKPKAEPYIFRSHFPDIS